ncbi:hypothetical protein [Streptomyces sp. NRRL S-1868]|uniref:hypothetical protein n=1 Tax=Streptomyces sp. NRRL S-1868 TaxID=1463892 RepID=UPI00131AAC99|nr:hypothetical protein [Streptomyces sp. NRRL S-1868]
MKRRAVIFTLLPLGVCLAVVAGLLTWWNTDLWGRDHFCGSLLDSSEVGAVLEGPGRLKEEGFQERDDALRCEVARYSGPLGGGDRSRAVVSTEFLEGDKPFRSAVWQRRKSMSFTRDALAGGATTQRAWVLLPSACWKHFPTRSGTVPFVTAELRDGDAPPRASGVSAPRRSLAQLARRGAQRVMKTAGCSSAAVREKASAQERPLTPAKTERSTAGEVCRMPGFDIPDSALYPGKAELGSERSTSPRGTAWTCDLHLEGKGKPALTLSASTHRDVVDAVKEQSNRRSSDEEKVVSCSQGELYVGMWVSSSNPYSGLLVERHGRDGKSVAKTFDEVLSSLATSYAEARGWSACSL